MSPIRRLARSTTHAAVPHLSSTPRHRLRQLQYQSKPDYPTPYHAQAHPLQMTTAITHVTSVELIMLMGALGILVAVLCWLAWIIFTYVLQFIREKIDDYNIGKRAKAHARRREEQIENAPKTVVKILKKIGGAANHVFEGLTRSGGWQEREFGGERRGLLQDAEWEPRRFGYHEGTIYRDIDGDGTSESTGSGNTTVKHRDDCVGQCGLPRRRSVEV